MESRTNYLQGRVRMVLVGVGPSDQLSQEMHKLPLLSPIPDATRAGHLFFLFNKPDKKNLWPRLLSIPSFFLMNKVEFNINVSGPAIRLNLYKSIFSSFDFLSLSFMFSN